MKTQTKSDSSELTAAARDARLAVMLNQHVADLVDLRSQALQAHWNVKGPCFAMLHALFEQVAREVDVCIDRVAERVAQLGHAAHGTVRVAARESRLPEHAVSSERGRDHVLVIGRALMIASRLLPSSIRVAEELNDAVTADLLTSVAASIEKLRWQVEAHLRGGE